MNQTVPFYSTNNQHAYTSRAAEGSGLVHETSCGWWGKGAQRLLINLNPRLLFVQKYYMSRVGKEELICVVDLTAETQEPLLL